MKVERELHDQFEEHLKENNHEIVTGDYRTKLFRPDTVAEKAGTTTLYEYKHQPSTQDFHRLVYQTFTYENGADKYFIVTKQYNHKVEQIADRTGWGYIVYHEDFADVVLPYEDKNELDSIKVEQEFETSQGEFVRKLKIRKKECPFCGKIVRDEKVLGVVHASDSC